MCSFLSFHTHQLTHQSTHTPIVSVRPDWRRVEEVDLSKLSKGTSPLSGLVDNSQPKQVEDLAWCGFLDQYNDQYDKVTTRTATQLKRVETKEFGARRTRARAARHPRVQIPHPIPRGGGDHHRGAGACVSRARRPIASRAGSNGLSWACRVRTLAATLAWALMPVDILEESLA